MNYVGQFAETVFVTVKELYRGLNPATLTGGIDVIVVRQPDGSFQCSPFHVRFGKLGVLRSKEKIVSVFLFKWILRLMENQWTLHMKLGDNGEAFFVEENENMEKKRRRKRIRSDTHLREDASSSSDEREREKEWEREGDQAGQERPAKDEPVTPLNVSKSIYYSLSEEPNEEQGPTQTRDTHPHSDGEQSPSENSVFSSRPSSPKSDSELLKSQESPGPQMQWNWGGFPTLCQSERTPVELQHISPSGNSHFRTIERQDSFDMGYEPGISCGRVGSVTVVRPQPRTQSLDLGSYGMQTTPLSKETNSHITHSTPSDLPESCAPSEKTNVDLTQALESTLGEENNRDSSSYAAALINGTDSLGSKESTTSVEHISTVTHIISPASKSSMVSVTESKNALIKESEDCTVTATSPSSTELTNPQQQGVLSEQNEQGSTSSATVSEGDSGIDPCAEGGEEEGGPGGAEGFTCYFVAGKRNHHLGPTDIYLDDLPKLDPEAAALYFPKSETEGASQQGAEQGSCSGSQSPQSVGSGAMDSGTEYLSDSTSYNMDISMSLCGQEGDTSQITKEKFMEHIVTYQDFVNNPGIIEDPSLVICINANYYNWAVAAPMVLSMATFQKNLPKSTVERLVKDKMPKKSGRWWFSWRRREMDSNQQKTSKDEQEDALASASSTVKATLDDIESDEAAGLGRTATIAPSLSTETLNVTQCITQMYRKSLRLTSEQIVRHSHITSDALGHILPQFGKDWTHKGIARLYHKIHQNGYKFLYCSARAIGMAAITKDYLQWVNDKGTVLPKGPVLLAPSSLFSALHREVIEKKPEVFKIACLSDIRDLFNPQKQPFYAAFGNRTNEDPDTKQHCCNASATMSVSETEANLSEKNYPEALALELTCPICLELFSEPVSLPCGHIYCLACLQTMGEGIDQYSCPECQTEYHGTKTLVKNFKMCSIIETYKATAGKVSPTANPDHTPVKRSGTEESTEQPFTLDQEQGKVKIEMDEPKFRLASQVTELSLKLEMAEGVLRKEKERELEVTTTNGLLREKASMLLEELTDLSRIYSAQVMQLIEEELGPGEASLGGRVSQASERTKQLRQALLRAESLLTEEDEAEFSEELQTLQPHIDELMAKPVEEEEDTIELKVNPTRACSELENMNAKLRDRFGDIQRSLRNTLNPSEVTFDPDSAHPNLSPLTGLEDSDFQRCQTAFPTLSTEVHQLLPGPQHPELL
ncbi:Phosphatidate phosphatase LPIN2 [Larimichthys crocea]|uniref:Uncharacterized protein n=1 Tax=Larimichthys crocea TaxID=215358 RepID=A0ACD3RI22_LARCR|nr:Phosphatidate phosphatase LPIN2 [Larimichthys crocea]